MRCRLLLCFSMVLPIVFAPAMCGAQTTASAVVSVSVRVEPAVTLACLEPIRLWEDAAAPPPVGPKPSVSSPVDPWGFGSECSADGPAWVDQGFLTNDSHLKCRASFVSRLVDFEAESPIRKKMLVWVVLPAD